MAAQSAKRNQAFVSPHLIGPQFLANQHETNQHESAALIGLFHATSSVLLSVESYRNYRKMTQRGVQGYLSSLQRRVLPSVNIYFSAICYNVIFETTLLQLWTIRTLCILIFSIMVVSFDFISIQQQSIIFTLLSFNIHLMFQSFGKLWALV